MEENNYCVYIHTNKINNKKYIGITCQNPSKRWGKNGCGYKNNRQTAFSNAIDKYGWDNFYHEIFVSGVSKQKACDLEVFLIELLRTRDNRYGYNIQKGGNLGNAGVTFSDEAKIKMSNAKKNRKLTEEHKKHISEGCIGHKPAVFTDEVKEKLRLANIGKTLSNETKNKISKSLTGIKRSQETLKKRKENNPMNVCVYCVELNITFPTITDAANYTGAQRSNIQKCLRGERHTAGKHPTSNIKLHWEKVEK